MTQSISDASFEEEVVKSKIPVLVDFWAEWCGPCRMLGPILDELSKELKEIKIVKMNVDDNPNTPSSLGVRGIPALFLFNDGKQVASKVGAMSKTALCDWIHSSLK